MVLLAEKPIVKGGKVMTADEFVDQLQEDCLNHPALSHSYLKRFENKELNKGHVKIFA